MGYQDEPNEKGNVPDVESQEEYEFLQETFKDENGKLKRSTIWRTAGLGLVFGLAASLAFFALKPWMEHLSIGEETVVTIEEDEDDGDEIVVEESDAPVISLDNYREMNKALTEIGDKANQSVVVLKGITSGSELAEEDYDKDNSMSGVIVADNGQELLIFSKIGKLSKADSVEAKFVDGRSYPAKLKQKETVLGYAVFAVSKNDLSEGTKSKISVATLGKTNTVAKGDAVIALGSPFGYPGAMGFGVVASAENTITLEDGEYRLICTDISGASGGTGILVNIDGEVVGIIDQSISSDDSMNLVTGFGISGIKGIIQLLSNGMKVPYLGISGVTVTEKVSQEQEVPIGVYVQSVNPDSPAMEAGIQSGDVIVGIEGEEVISLKSLHTKLLKQSSSKNLKLQVVRQGADGYTEVEHKVAMDKE